MKIILSPSKTKKLDSFPEIEEFRDPLFSKISNKIIKEISKFSLDKIEYKFKLKKEQSENLLKFYKNYKNEKFGHALTSYSGIAYKSLNPGKFSKEDVGFAEEHLVILSALYGIVTPLTKLKAYRLDMVNSIFNEKSLYEIWKKDINKYFEREDVIINLASKEYSKIINNENIYNFEFYSEGEKGPAQISTNSKKMRGFTANYIIKNRIVEIEKLKNADLDGYIYNESMSSEKKYVYIKNNS